MDPRPSKAIPQPEKTRFILVHDLPIEGRDDGITSVRFEVPADGIIDDLKQAISESLTNPRLYLPRRAFFLKLMQPNFLFNGFRPKLLAHTRLLASLNSRHGLPPNQKPVDYPGKRGTCVCKPLTAKSFGL